MFAKIRSFSPNRRFQKGITTVEYAVAGGLIAVAVIAGFLTLGKNVGSVIDAIAKGIVQ
jgi:pilus assembly protein Flp/PilA